MRCYIGLMTKEKTPLKKINLALQGGGAHGAFTWGVLDKLLEKECFDIEGISATSAGSMNAVVMVAGWIENGKDGARTYLEKFWKDVSDTGNVFSPVEQSIPDWVGNWGKGWTNQWSKLWDTPWAKGWADQKNNAAHFMNLLSQNISPYQFNPFNINPLKNILDDLVDFEKIRTQKDMQLFITATNVKTGDARIFKNEELTADMVLASSALPNIFQAVEVDGDFFWDGGFVGNPSLWPLFYGIECHDILIVHVNPLVRDDIPKDAPSIENRLNEITFNTSLLKELRAISFVQKLLDRNMLKDEHKNKYRDVLIHAIRAEESMSKLDLSSKFDTSWGFLVGLRDAGREMAENWIDRNHKNVGKKSTIDIARDYLA